MRPSTADPEAHEPSWGHAHGTRAHEVLAANARDAEHARPRSSTVVRRSAAARLQRPGAASTSPPLPPSVVRVHGALIAVSLLFGANYVVTKHLLAALPAPVWVLFRMAGATLLLVPLAAWWARSGPWPKRALWPALALAALLGVAANQALFTEGLARTTAEHSAVVNACIPTWTLLVAVLVGQERLTLRRIVAVSCAFGGVAWLLGVDRLLAGQGLADASFAGDLLTLGNGLAFAGHLVWLRRIGRDLHPAATTAMLFLFGTPMIVVWSGPHLTSEHVATVLATPYCWLAAYAIVFATVLTYGLNTWALRHAQSSQVALYINLQPIVAAACNAALGAPLPGHRFFTALAMVTFGLWLQAKRPPDG